MKYRRFVGSLLEEAACMWTKEFGKKIDKYTRR